MLHVERERPLVPFDLAPILRVVRFVRSAVRAHRLAAIVVALGLTSVAVAAAVVLPRTYSGDTRVLTKKNYLMAAIAAPRRTVPTGAETPAQSAHELALQHDALVTIVRQAHLVERWPTTQPTLVRWKERVRAAISGPVPPAELEEAMVGMLQQRLSVNVEDNEVVRIRVTWWTADDVPVILREAEAAFRASRQKLDVETIATTAEILRKNTAVQEALVQTRLVAFGEARAHAAGVATAAHPVKRDAGSLEVYRLKLLAARRTREELQRQRDLRIGDLQMQVAEQSASLGERHPDLIAAKAALTRLNDDDGGVLQATAAEQEIEKQYMRGGGSLSELNGVSGNNRDYVDAASNPDDDAGVIYARAMLRMAVDDYQDLTSRLTNANLELETARAAFAYRFIETSPPVRPRKADSPNVVLLVIGGLLGGLAAGVTASVGLALRQRIRGPVLLRAAA